MSGIAVLAAVSLVAGGAYVGLGDDGYELEFTLESAIGVEEGAKAQIDGIEVGSVSSIEHDDGSALLSVAIDDEHAPLHAGTTAMVEWRSVLGERFVTLKRGPDENEQLDSGSRIEAGGENVRVEDLLETLDAPTRRSLSEFLQQLQTPVEGEDDNLQGMIQSLGPAVQQLGGVLEAIGQDGPAIRTLVTRMREVTDTLATRQSRLDSTIGGLGDVTAKAAQEQEQLTAALDELPGTLEDAENTLDSVPTTVDDVTPLLQDLRPVAARLPGIADDLAPMLADARSTVAELGPTLQAADGLLGETPELLDRSHSVVPDAGRLVQKVQPAVSFLRPYTPGLAGWVTNWASAFSAYDGAGHYARAELIGGPSAVDNNPGVVPPGLTQEKQPDPGYAGDEPWTDAHGSGVR
ncbi:MlaD family protein [Haloechinothrix alba]|nr:MlaD family protein [Haloechinothrix alba]